MLTLFNFILQELSAEEVMQAYIHRVNSTNTITAAMVENRFKDAMTEAKAVDEILSKDDVDIEELKVCRFLNLQ